MIVEIYGRDGCSACKQAEKMCIANNITYTYNDVVKDATQKTLLEQRLTVPVRSVPQIFIDDIHIKTGFAGLREHIIANS